MYVVFFMNCSPRILKCIYTLIGTNDSISNSISFVFVCELIKSLKLINGTFFLSCNSQKKTDPTTIIQKRFKNNRVRVKWAYIKFKCVSRDRWLYSLTEPNISSQPSAVRCEVMRGGTRCTPIYELAQYLYYVRQREYFERTDMYIINR